MKSVDKPIASVTTMHVNPEEFRRVGHELVDRLAQFLAELPSKRVTRKESGQALRRLLQDERLPEAGADMGEIMRDSTDLLLEYSLFNGHPRFFGYITSSAAPIGALSDLLVSAINPNVGAYALAPIATEIERQTIGWLADLVGYPTSGGGIFVSGGSMANYLGFLAARNKVRPLIKTQGLRSEAIQERQKCNDRSHSGKQTGKVPQSLTLYCSTGTHAWVEKAAEMFGHGTSSIRWIPCNADTTIDTELLEKQIFDDLVIGHVPFMVIGTAGSVSTGAIDNLSELSRICKRFDVWLHVDGAYGAPAVAVQEWAHRFKGMEHADSIALDPHKWLYSPIEAGCILVRRSKDLKNTFSHVPEYYNFKGNENEDEPLNYYEYGMQNSRSFRALKVWTSLRQVGRVGLAHMIQKDIQLSEVLCSIVKRHPLLEFFTQNLSITTFRFVPREINVPDREMYLNELNKSLLNRLQENGEVFLSNAIIDKTYLLRTCIVNFRTSLEDLYALVEIIIREGNDVHAHLMNKAIMLAEDKN